MDLKLYILLMKRTSKEIKWEDEDNDGNWDLDHLREEFSKRCCKEEITNNDK